jgi:transcriptional regulator with XRE-family HTH domain
VTFAEQIRTGRTRLGLTQEKFAELLDVSKTTVEAWERNDPRRQPLELTREGALARLAAAEADRETVPTPASLRRRDTCSG